jgi:hypothetical protein
MTDFKVGDRVRVILGAKNNSKYSNHRTPIGYEAELDEFTDLKFWKTKQGVDFWPHEIELISDVPSHFKVGDRVFHETHGCGTVKVVDNDDEDMTYRIDFDVGNFYWVHANKVKREKTTETTETPVTPATQSIEHKFKVGDRVKISSDWYVGPITDGVVTGSAPSGCRGNFLVKTNIGEHLGFYDIELSPVKTKTAIVALIENDTPKPSERPYVHATAEAATKEAERLARKYAGQKFGIYELVSTRFAQVDVNIVKGDG